MAASGARHPQEQHAIAFWRKYPTSARYMKATADMMREQYPGSWGVFRPILLELHKQMREKEARPNY